MGMGKELGSGNPATVSTRISNFTPDGWHTVTPRIVVRGARELVEFIKQVFDATGNYRPDRPAVINIGDSMIMISEAGMRNPVPAFLYVYVKDTDATYRRAIEAGASPLEEPSDVSYGDRRGMVEDRWDNTWQIATHKEWRTPPDKPLKPMTRTNRKAQSKRRSGS
jgi:PhnB protein